MIKKGLKVRVLTGKDKTKEGEGVLGSIYKFFTDDFPNLFFINFWKKFSFLLEGASGVTLGASPVSFFLNRLASGFFILYIQIKVKCLYI